MKKHIFIIIGLFLAVTLVFFTWFYINIQPFSPGIDKQINFMINKGDGLSSIGRRLGNLKIIKNSSSFSVLAYFLGLDKKIQAGNFIVSPGLSVKEIIEKLSKAGTHDYWLQIIGGMRNEEIVKKLPENLSFTFDEFLNYSLKEQGYLFPDSYLIPESYSPEQIIKLIRKNFDLKIDEVRSSTTNPTIKDRDIIILASLVEREGRSLESKQYIAGILQNRLKINMPLQVDATVQYARDTKYIPKKYWEPLLKKDLGIISPYNTYLNRGLPPGPICNPGLDSIRAVFNPILSEYLFYLTGNDNKMHYAKTLQEHNLNISKYLN